MRKIFLYFLAFSSFTLANCSASKHSNLATNTNHSLLTFKVMTYNVHHCNPPSESKTGKIDIDAITNVIRNQNPDLVAVQELDDHTTRSGAFSELEVIAKKLNMHFYFGKAMDFAGGGYGVGILSKYPISDGTTHQLPVVPGWKGEPRVLATAKITLPDGNKIVFGSTHLEAYNKENRELQVREILRIASTETLPFIVAGDFNATPESAVIRILDSIFLRTCTSQCPVTFDEEGDSGTIDYIAFRPVDQFQVIQHQVIEEKYASDHYPVVAILKIK